MRRRIVLLHAAEEGEWAHRAVMRLGKEHDVRRVELRAEHHALLRREAPGGVDLFVVVLGPGLLRDARARFFVESLFHEFRSDWLTVIEDRRLERSIPAYLGHIHALVPHGDPIAALGARLARGSPPVLVPRHGAGLVVALVVLVATAIVVGVGATTGLWHRGLGVLEAQMAVWEPAMPGLDAEDSVGGTGDGRTPGAGENAAGSEPALEGPARAGADAGSPAAGSMPPRGTGDPVVLSPPHLTIEPYRVTRGSVISMVYLEGGSFLMGDPDSKRDYMTPREATVSGFWMAQAEVTQAQWEAVMDEQPSSLMADLGDDLPVQNVSWNDALEFLNRLSAEAQLVSCYEREGKQWRWVLHCDGFRLPTEAEWEYAARAGANTRFFYGNSRRESCKYGNFADTSARAIHYNWDTVGCTDRYPQLAPVRSFEPNDWKLYDVHGNVREWVWDRRGPYPSVFPPDHAGPQEGEYRVIRGGSYDTHPSYARLGYRWGAKQGYKSRNLGLRVARTGPKGRVDASLEVETTSPSEVEPVSNAAEATRTSRSEPAEAMPESGPGPDPREAEMPPGDPALLVSMPETVPMSLPQEVPVERLPSAGPQGSRR